VGYFIEERAGPRNRRRLPEFGLTQCRQVTKFRRGSQGFLTDESKEPVATAIAQGFRSGVREVLTRETKEAGGSA